MWWSDVGRAVFWGLIGGLTAIQTAGGLPDGWGGWAGLGLSILWAAYGKGTSSSKMWVNGRDEWSDAKRAMKTGASLSIRSNP